MFADSFRQKLVVVVLAVVYPLAGWSAGSPATDPPLTSAPAGPGGQWPFDADEALRRQAAAAETLHLPVEAVLDLGAEVTIDLVLIPGGTFMMGSPDGSYADESPQRRVTISRAFYLSRTEVTQAQWQAVMKNNPSLWPNNPNRPVDNVSWSECQVFCHRLSGKLARQVRLPSEAEWEYACRAGTDTQYSFGDRGDALARYAWFNGNAGGQTHPVAQRSPNVWGLYDVHGNVWEWCQDAYAAYEGDNLVDPRGPAGGEVRVMRGGSWSSARRVCRSAFRVKERPAIRAPDCGFRVAVGT